MAVREFVDGHGRDWRAWEIMPEAIHPVTRAEDYLSDCYTVGWLVFESMSGDDKRRLCPYPKASAKANALQLSGMLVQSDKAPARKLDAERQAVGSPTAPPIEVPPEEDKLDVTDL